MAPMRAKAAQRAKRDTSTPISIWWRAANACRAMAGRGSRGGARRGGVRRGGEERV